MADQTGARVNVPVYEYFEKEARRFKDQAIYFRRGQGSIEKALADLLQSHAEVLSILGQLEKEKINA